MAILEADFTQALGDTGKPAFLHGLWGLEVNEDVSVAPFVAT